MRHLRDAETLAQALGDIRRQGRIVTYLEEALPLLEQALRQGTSIRQGDWQTLRMILLGTGYLHAGQPQDALPLVQEALALARERQERGVEVYAFHLLASLAACGTPPDVAQAETCFQQAMALASDLGMRPLLAHSALGLGTLYRQLGQATQAYATLSTARELFDAMQMTPWRTEAETILARVS